MSLQYFTADQLEGVSLRPVPQHIAIIPDGNRRWAKSQQKSVQEGHQKGSDNIIDVVKAAKQLGVKALTFYLFSTENWKRSPEEIEAQMWLLEYYLISQCPSMIENGIRVSTIGDIDKFPAPQIKAIESTISATAHCTDVDLILALNYGSRNEICRSVTNLINDIRTGKLENHEISERLLSSYLDTSKWPDPDLLIRTSGEQRISNFLLWQLSYAEIYVTKIFWPDFTPFHLFEAVLDFQQRERRLGGS